MKTIPIIVLTSLILANTPIMAGDCSVCLGPYLSIVLNDEQHVSLTIGDSKRIYIKSRDDLPKIVAENLDSTMRYRVRIYYDNKVVESWHIDFKKLQCKMVRIWRSAGAWRMEPVPSNTCE
jgi:hypothetical protein